MAEEKHNIIAERTTPTTIKYYKQYASLAPPPSNSINNNAIMNMMMIDCESKKPIKSIHILPICSAHPRARIPGIAHALQKIPFVHAPVHLQVQVAGVEEKSYAEQGKIYPLAVVQ